MVNSLHRLILPLFAAHATAYQWIAGYEPRTLVTSDAAIDLDLQEIEQLMEIEKLRSAKGIYMQGGHAQSIARLKIVNASALEYPIPRGTLAYGIANNGDAIKGTIAEEADWEDEDEAFLFIEYTPSAQQEDYLHCQVGGLVPTGAGNMEGCFAESGTIRVLDFRRGVPSYDFEYIYDPEGDNRNAVSIQKLSTFAEDGLDCATCHYVYLAKYQKYYGTSDYGNQFALAAFDGAKTSLERGDVDFREHRPKSRSEAVKIASKFMNVWMHVIQKMEYALEQCNTGCDSAPTAHTPPAASEHGRCSDTHIQAWDQAVAYYAGSLEGEAGLGDGLLLFDLAEEMCTTFRTCGEDATLAFGTSFVNNLVINEFSEGQFHLMKRDCEGAKVAKDVIVKTMTIPLIQATLYYAYKREHVPTSSAEEDALVQMSGATFAATVTPLVHECHHRGADIIYTQLQHGDPNEVDFTKVKHAFEQSYHCMGVTCSNIGGIWEDGQYASGASPCQDSDLDSSFPLPALLLSIGVVLGAIGLVALRQLLKNQGIDRNSDQTLSPDHVLQMSREID